MKHSAHICQAAKKFLLLGLSVGLVGCSGLLPKTTQETKTPWNSYADAAAMYAKIVPQQTTVAELKALSIDPDHTPNVAILSHADLLRRLVPSSALDVRTLAPSIQECIAAYQSCYGYQIEQTHLYRKRYGNFALDFMNFKKLTDVSGWQFDAIVVINDKLVIYKQWSGKPSIHQLEEERNPLGPLQGFGPSLVPR